MLRNIILTLKVLSRSICALWTIIQWHCSCRCVMTYIAWDGFSWAFQVLEKGQVRETDLSIYKMTLTCMLLLQLIVSCMFFCKKIRRVGKGSLESHFSNWGGFIKVGVLIFFEPVWMHSSQSPRRFWSWSPLTLHSLDICPT